MPLPLQSQLARIELITFHRSLYRPVASYIRLAMPLHRLATTITILVCPDDRPIVFPLHRVQMDNTSVRTFILKVHEPRVTDAGFTQPP